MKEEYFINYQVYGTKVVFSSEPYPDLRSAVRDFCKVEHKNKRDNVWISEKRGADFRKLRKVTYIEIGKILEEIVERER